MTLPDNGRRLTAPLLTVRQDRLAAAILRRVADANSSVALTILWGAMLDCGMNRDAEERQARTEVLKAAERLEGAVRALDLDGAA